ncbi:C4-dicarboxylate TRAP transporter substrate-binding protein [Roseovarius pacificus]|uniref:C4-dicarboxylate TRAP transporter substrate-binding protein n=1 Tax=Roseovarius pacificus TaxID=337701 RepID=UPI002A187748|nr:C4-dicarboxylate TRAP transporter substrate-binding protein [Roseovarius pacificus]
MGNTILTKIAAMAGAMLFGAAASAEEMPSGTWNVGHFSTESWSSSKVDVLFMKEVEDRTDGALKARFHWAGAMGSGTELLELTSAGAVDIGSIVPSYYPGQMPLLSLPSSLPLTWEDPVLARAVMQGLARDNEHILSELERNNVWPILFHVLPAYRLQCTKPVQTLEDLKGLRVRTFGEWPPQMFQELGAVPVNIAFTEVYEALQRGSLDCSYLSIEGAGAMKIAEVAKYWSDINLGSFGGYPLFVAKDRYDSWPEEFRQVLTDAARVAEDFERSNYQVLEDQTLESVQEAGVELVTFSDQSKLSEVTSNYLSKWVEAMCDRDLCGEAKDVEADVTEIMEKWQ